MASVWARKKATKAGHRYRVEYRLGGRSTSCKYAGTFNTLREADLRKKYVADELAAFREPDQSLATVKGLTVKQAVELWQASRVDVAEATRIQHRTAVRRIPASLMKKRVDAVTPQDVAMMVATLHEAGKRRESIRKTVTALAMVLDHQGISPNPARNKVVAKLPREEKEEPNPPSADHVIAVYRLVPARHRLPLLWLDWSGARVGSIDDVLVGDYDERRRRVRLRAATTKTRRALLGRPARRARRRHRAEARPARRPRPDGAHVRPVRSRCPTNVDRQSLQGRRHPALESARPAKPARQPAARAGKTWAAIGAFVGQRDIATTASVYTHVLADEQELNYAELLG